MFLPREGREVKVNLVDIMVIFTKNRRPTKPGMSQTLGVTCLFRTYTKKKAPNAQRKKSPAAIVRDSTRRREVSFAGGQKSTSP